MKSGFLVHIFSVKILGQQLFWEIWWYFNAIMVSSARGNFTLRTYSNSIHGVNLKLLGTMVKLNVNALVLLYISFFSRHFFPATAQLKSNQVFFTFTKTQNYCKAFRFFVLVVSYFSAKLGKLFICKNSSKLFGVSSCSCARFVSKGLASFGCCLNTL